MSDRDGRQRLFLRSRFCGGGGPDVGGGPGVDGGAPGVGGGTGVDGGAPH